MVSGRVDMRPVQAIRSDLDASRIRLPLPG